MFRFVSGIDRISLIDFPGVPSAVLFYAGCNLRCPYCHNSSLVLDPRVRFSEDTVEEWLKESNDKGLEGAVLTGGEPMLHPAELVEDIGWLHSHGFRIKLDTNGLLWGSTDMDTLLPMVEYLAVDYKLPLKRYGELGAVASVDGLKSLLTRLDTGRVPESYELRTTVCPALLGFDDLEAMAEGIPRNRWWLQQFRGGNVLSPDVAAVEPYPDSTLVEWARKLGCKVRGVVEG